MQTEESMNVPHFGPVSDNDHADVFITYLHC